MVAIARGYLLLACLMFGVVGLAGLIAPESVAEQLGLQLQTTAGIAEFRGLYGGALLSWCIILIGAWRHNELAQGFLLAMMLTMSSITAARVISLAIDHEFLFNIAAGLSEALIALACWILYMSKKTAIELTR